MGVPETRFTFTWFQISVNVAKCTKLESANKWQRNATSDIYFINIYVHWGNFCSISSHFKNDTVSLMLINARYLGGKILLGKIDLKLDRNKDGARIKCSCTE